MGQMRREYNESKKTTKQASKSGVCRPWSNEHSLTFVDTCCFADFRRLKEIFLHSFDSWYLSPVRYIKFSLNKKQTHSAQCVYVCLCGCGMRKGTHTHTHTCRKYFVCEENLWSVVVDLKNENEFLISLFPLLRAFFFLCYRTVPLFNVAVNFYLMV